MTTERPNLRRWEIIYTHRSAYSGLSPRGEGGEFDHELGHSGLDGLTERDSRTHHRSYLAADFHRRFRFRPLVIGMRWVETLIVRTADQVEWSSSGMEMAQPPRYGVILERRVWPALYWLRSRWDGLRYGKDRDSRW